MKDRINIAELLKDCPKGMELDCTMYDRVTFDEVTTVIGFDDNKRVKIILSTHYSDGTKDEINLTEYGTYTYDETAKCVIFPKGKTTWEGFVTPYEFKDGDIIFTHSGKYSWISIFKQFSGKSCCTYIDLCTNDNDLANDTRCLCYIEEINAQRLATEEEKEKLFQVIKDNGFSWNPETNTLEKLINPKFKVGDKIVNILRKRMGASGTQGVISEITDDKYIFIDGSYIFIKDQDNWELVSDKFDITTLKPFESRVLMRSSNAREWTGTIFSHYSNNKFYGCGMCCDQCIPYEGNEHLLGKTDDCDEFFKTWK